MGKIHKIYKSIKLETISDIDALIAMIENRGGFTLADYNYLVQEARNSPYKDRLILRLRKKVYPLIGTYVQKPSCQNVQIKKEPLNEIDWNKTYKASDFTLHDGKITLGKIELKSVRIKETHPSWLKDIEHDFRIAPEVGKENRFHFVPYTDLSFILEAIESQVKEQRRQQEQKTLRQNLILAKESFREEVYKYLGIGNKHTFDIVGDKLYKAGIIREIDIAEIKKYHFGSEDLLYTYDLPFYVRPSSVKWENGVIKIYLRKAFLTRNSYIERDGCVSTLYKPGEEGYVESPSFDEFVERDLYYKDVIINHSDYFRKEYESIVKTVLEKISSYRKVSFETYVDEHNFKAFLKNRPLYFVIDQDCKPVWSVGNLISMHGSIDEYKGRAFGFRKEHKTKIESVLSNLRVSSLNKDERILYNWFNRYPDEIFHGLLTEKFDENRIIPRYLTQFAENVKYKIISFTEAPTHFSDRDSWGFGEDCFKTYLVWEKRKPYAIHMIPSNRKYADYTFYVAEGSMEMAAFIIYHYFSSGIDNKRQGFKITELFKAFGVYSVKK